MTGRAIEKRFVVGVHADRAWEAFTDPAQRRCWDAPIYEIDARPGGKVHWEIPAGLRVVGVTPGGYGEEAGFQPGDVVVRIGGVPIFVRSDLWGVQYAHAPGTPLAAEFARDGTLLRGHGRLRENVPTG